MSKELVSIEDELLALRDRIAQLHQELVNGEAVLNSSSLVIQVEDLCALADEELRDRSRRAAHFPEALFGEPAWDILLDLYSHACRGLQVSVTSACLAAHVPVTTGLRWIGLLESGGYIQRRPSDKDRRAVILDLTADGRSRIENILSERIHRRSMRVRRDPRQTGEAPSDGRDTAEKLLIIQPGDPSLSH